MNFENKVSLMSKYRKIYANNVIFINLLRKNLNFSKVLDLCNRFDFIKIDAPSIMMNVISWNNCSKYFFIIPHNILIIVVDTDKICIQKKNNMAFLGNQEGMFVCTLIFCPFVRSLVLNNFKIYQSEN